MSLDQTIIVVTLTIVLAVLAVAFIVDIGIRIYRVAMKRVERAFTRKIEQQLGPVRANLPILRDDMAPIRENLGTVMDRVEHTDLYDAGYGDLGD